VTLTGSEILAIVAVCLVVGAIVGAYMIITRRRGWM
jgi:hypothetical protein